MTTPGIADAEAGQCGIEVKQQANMDRDSESSAAGGMVMASFAMAVWRTHLSTGEMSR
jgi:hypothetical protein